MTDDQWLLEALQSRRPINDVNEALRFYVPAGIARSHRFPFDPGDDFVMRTVPGRAVVFHPPEYSHLTTIEIPEMRL